MNFIGLFYLKLLNFFKKSFKSLNNKEDVIINNNNNNINNNNKNNNYQLNNDYNDYNDMFNEIVNENNFNHENSLNKKVQDEDNDYKIEDDDEDDSNFFKNIFSKIKKKFFINKNNNKELIFKELKNQFDSNYPDNHLDNHPDNYQNIASNDLNESIKNNNFFEKFSLNKILNQNIQEKLNLKIAIPLIIAILAICILLSYIFLGFEISLAIVLISLIGFFLILYFPQMEKKRKYSEISRELPYALRHMVTELKSGKGLHDTLYSIATHDYGALSEEFSRVLEEIKYRENTETALLNMSKRVSSNGLNRTVGQIIGTLRTGGNLSNTLGIIAEDITHELQMELKDYSQKLNAFIMIYTFLAILGPVILLIMLMAASTVMGDIVPSEVVLIMYVFFFPMIVVFMGLMIKRLEPNL